MKWGWVGGGSVGVLMSECHTYISSPETMCKVRVLLCFVMDDLAHPFHLVNDIGADDRVTQGARTSTVMALARFTLNIFRSFSAVRQSFVDNIWFIKLHIIYPLCLTNFSSNVQLPRGTSHPTRRQQIKHASVSTGKLLVTWCFDVSLQHKLPTRMPLCKSHKIGPRFYFASFCCGYHLNLRGFVKVVYRIQQD